MCSHILSAFNWREFNYIYLWWFQRQTNSERRQTVWLFCLMFFLNSRCPNKGEKSFFRHVSDPSVSDDMTPCHAECDSSYWAFSFFCTRGLLSAGHPSAPSAAQKSPTFFFFFALVLREKLPVLNFWRED